MCGTQYVLDENMRPVRLEVTQCKLVTIGSSVTIPGYSLMDHPKECTEYTLREMAVSMAEKLLPLMEFQTMYEPMHNEYVTYARLRVAEPKAGFTYNQVEGRSLSDVIG
jgi:hypothetical protein